MVFKGSHRTLRMTKNTNQKLRKKLKAASKRRANRPMAAQVSVPPATVSQRVDVLGLLVQATMDYAASKSDLDDRAVIAALRASKKGAAPTGSDSAALYRLFDAVSNTDGVTQNSYQDAIRQLSELATQQRDADDDDSPSAFLNYLAVLC